MDSAPISHILCRSLDQALPKLSTWCHAEICVRNVNELAKYGMVETDEFGFVLNPLGKTAYKEELNPRNLFFLSIFL